ncbi:MAG: PBP1A family penicillin-binding protein [Pseudomonadota bacterium]
MSDWFFRQGGRNRILDLMGFEAWFFEKLALPIQRVKEAYSAGSSLAARFKLRGWSRVFNELASEALTIGAAGFTVLFVLGNEAYKEIDEARWRSMGSYSVTFLDRDRREVGRRGIFLNDSVPLKDIPEVMINAALATEDRRFYDHYGIDIIGTLRALIENVRANDVVQGGSTITQQLAKNLFLSSERSIQRKIKEAFLALWLEARLPKNEILKLYLDRAYMGGGAFGVEAAAQFYFGKSVKDVTMAEAAMLAGLFKAPTKYAPHIDLAAARARANEVLSNLVEAGYYTAGQVYEARLNPADPVERTEANSPDWFLDWAFEEVQRIMKGKDKFVLTVRLTVDLGLQRTAEQAIQSIVANNGRGRAFRNGALVSMEPNGAVRALVGGVDYGDSQFNRATNARRQPGSSFKAYVYAAGLMNGYSLNSRLRDSSPRCGRWSPRNYNGSYGSGRRVSMLDAFRRSLNTTAVAISLDVGRNKVIDLTKKLGIKGVRRSCSIALGDTGITLLQHTSGYAAFASGGMKVTPYAVLEIYDSQGKTLYVHSEHGPKPERVMPRRVAESMNILLKSVVDGGTGRRAQLEFTNAVGKTGTSSSYRDALFMGFTGQFVTGVWFGNDDYRPMVNRYGKGVTGGSFPAQAWQTYMAAAHRTMDIPTIPGLQPHPVQVDERARLARLRTSDPTLAPSTSNRNAPASGRLPAATRKVLEALRAKLKGLKSAPGESPASAPNQPDREKRPDQRAKRTIAPEAKNRPVKSL